MTKKNTYQWQFSPRFRRNAFGWRSQTPMQRIKEAITEIRSIARKDPVLAAEGAVLFLEKISPALSNVDSSSGAIGGAVNHAVTVLAPIISKATVSDKVRQKWLTRLWDALQSDEMPYIEYLGEFWGELCVTPAIASYWVDQFIGLVKYIWSPEATGHNFFKGTTPCLSALYAAGRYQELLALLDNAPFKWWYDRCWGVKALLALGNPDAALDYAQNSRGLNEPAAEIAKTCEEILLSKGLIDEAYKYYAFEANQHTTNLATFRALTKKYPHKPPINILQDLIASQPGAEGKWFAAAKDAGFFDLAIELVTRSPADPRTLTRAAKDFAHTQPNFALAAGMAALHWIIQGYGYEILNTEILDAYHAILHAADAAGLDASEIKKKILGLFVEQEAVNSEFVKNVLIHFLTR